MQHVSVAHSHSQPFEKMTGRSVFAGCNHDSLSTSTLAVCQSHPPCPYLCISLPLLQQLYFSDSMVNQIKELNWQISILHHHGSATSAHPVTPVPQNTGPVPASLTGTCTGSRDDTGNCSQRKKRVNIFKLG